jgi:Mg-chelatase subunit ChlD
MAAKGVGRNKLCIANPAIGQQKDDPEVLAREIGLKDVARIVNVAELSELVVVSVDCSGSMSWDFANTQHFTAA